MALVRVVACWKAVYERKAAFGATALQQQPLRRESVLRAYFILAAFEVCSATMSLGAEDRLFSGLPLKDAIFRTKFSRLLQCDHARYLKVVISLRSNEHGHQA